MATFVLIHGGGDSGSCWDLVAPELRARGHDVVAPDLPITDESAGFSDYVATVMDAIGGRGDLVVVGHSLGGFTAPLVPADLLVLVAAMVPAPGETTNNWWATSGYEAEVEEQEYDETALFFNDVPPELVAWSRKGWRSEVSAAGGEPWPLDSWPDVPTRYLLCRDDRLFPADWTRTMVQRRLGIAADELDGGHCPFLSRPTDLAERLHAYRAAL
jgi:pimeloyl-ACP methyl ester carboxylesterase